MSSSITVSVRTLTLVLVGVFLLVAAYVLGGAGAPDAAAQQSAAETQVPPDSTPGGPAGTVTMTGTGEATGVPDQLSFKLAVTRKALDVSTAMDDASSTMSRVLAALGASGVQRKDTQSTGLSIDPIYRYDNNAPPVITGYRVKQSASVLVRDLRSGGKAVSAAVTAGGNAVRVSDIGLKIGDRDDLLVQARDDAVAAASAKARQYAEATGQTLGRVLTLIEGRKATKPQPQATAAYDARAVRDLSADKAVPLRAGREDLKVNVSIVWELG